MGQHCTGQNPMQCCPGGSRQHCKKKKNPVQFCLDTLRTTLHRSKLYAMLPERLQTTLHKKKPCAMLSYNSWGNIAQLKTLCNFARMQCCSEYFKQHFTGKYSGNSSNVFWTTSSNSVYICGYQVLQLKKI